MARVLKFLGGLLLLASFSETAQAQSSDWLVSETAGTVTIDQGGRAHPAARGAVVSPGATISTAAGARAVVVHGRDFVTVSPNSRIRIPAVSERQGLFQIIEDWGNAIFQIEKQAAPHFGVRTPYLAAVVKGTTFSITVTPAGASLQVIEGAVETSTVDGGASEIIRPGTVATVGRTDLYRMTVQGQDVHQVDSPQRSSPEHGASAPATAPAPVSTLNGAPQATPDAAPAPEAAVPSAAATRSNPVPESVGTQAAAQTDQVVFAHESKAEVRDVMADITHDEGGASAIESQVIASPIASKPVDFTKTTDGLVGGNSAPQLVTTQSVSARDAARSDDGGSGANGIGSSGNGGNGNGNSGSNGNASGNSGSSGNGNGNSGSNGSGNGNANSGSNGSGNGNANSGSNGSGNGNGNANSGSNGNASGNSGSSGNANSNSGSNGNASGNSGSNGNANGNSGGNGNANGNSGSNGNANGNSGGNGNANGNSGSNGDANGSSSSNGNANENSSSNGNASGSSGSNGNASGNSGSNGNANSNSGSNGNANGSSGSNGNASGSSGSNGNASGSSGSNGNANSGSGSNGNANGSSSSNGNANENSGSNGNANSGKKGS